ESVGNAVFLTSSLLPINLHTQGVFNQRASHIDIGLETVAGIPVPLHHHFIANTACPFIGHFLCDDIGHAAHCLRSLNRRHGSSNHFNALDSLHGRQPPLLNTRPI